MTELEFGDLCRALCTALQVRDINSLSTKGRVQVDGIPIGLCFDQSSAPDQIFCYADLGPIEPALQLTAYEHLLTLNLLSASKTSGYYGLEPLTGHAVFTVILTAPDSIEPRSLAQQLRGYAEQAHRLRGTLLSRERRTKKRARPRVQVYDMAVAC